MHIEENPDDVRAADLIVGIPSYNEAKLISWPTQMASEGLIKYFGNKNSVIINCDNNSPDGTRDAFMNTPTEVPKIYLSTPPGVKGKGNNIRNLFKKSCDLGAQAVLVVDADLKSITPRWIKNLGEPLFEDLSEHSSGLSLRGPVPPRGESGECAGFDGDRSRRPESASHPLRSSRRDAAPGPGANR